MNAESNPQQDENLQIVNASDVYNNYNPSKNPNLDLVKLIKLV